MWLVVLSALSCQEPEKHLEHFKVPVFVLNTSYLQPQPGDDGGCLSDCWGSTEWAENLLGQHPHLQKLQAALLDGTT